MVYAKGTFLWWRLCVPSVRTITYIVNKQTGICAKYLLLQVLRVRSVKTKTNVNNRFKILLFSNWNEKSWNKSILIWVGFLGVHFYPLCSNETTSFETMNSFEFAYISCIWYIWLLWPISTLAKNFSWSKKVYINVFLNRFILIQLTFSCSNSMTSFWHFYC